MNLRDDVPDFSDTFQFVVGKIEQVLKGQPVGESPPPPLSMRSNYLVEVRKLITTYDKFD